MRWIFFSLLLMACASASTGAASPEPAATYKTAKTLAQLEQCMTRNLTKRGDVTAINAEGYTTLMFRETTEGPMLIDLKPPEVIVTTQFAYGTRVLIEACL